jgi:excinuclease ABC subunit A
MFTCNQEPATRVDRRMNSRHNPVPAADVQSSAGELSPRGYVRVRGAREHNLKNIDVAIPRDALVVFTGVSGSGKSSLAFGTLYAEAQRRYLESVSPYARRLFHQIAVPEVDRIDGLPPAVALQAQRGTPTTRSSVGSVTTLSNLLRILYSRAGDYPPRQPLLYAESFSANTPEGACPTCHGMGRIYDVSERLLVPDDQLTIREGASYQGTFTSAKKYVIRTFAATQSALMKKRVAQYMTRTDCPLCAGKRLRRESLSVKFAGFDFADISRQPLKCLRAILAPFADGTARADASEDQEHPEKIIVKQRIAFDLIERLDVLLALGLGYLTLERSTPTLSPGELQRLRLATQARSNLFGVVYVLDEPSAGLHPADTEALLAALGELKAAGNSLFVIEHDLDIIRSADWIVDVGPAAGENGGYVLYSGPPAGLAQVEPSQTRRHLFPRAAPAWRTPRSAQGWLRLSGVTRNNLDNVDAEFPLGVLTSVTGVSGSGKSSLVSQALADLTAAYLGHELPPEEDNVDALGQPIQQATGGYIAGGMEAIKRLVRVDQKPIGRTPRSNLATYTGLFDHIRKLFAATTCARNHHYDASRFSFNVSKGRCATCTGDGQVIVELLFLPSVYAPCPACHGARYNAETLAILYRDKNIAEVLQMPVDAAWEFFAGETPLLRQLAVLRDVGLGYLRLGQAATELSGGEAQRVKLATELQRPQKGDTLYILDEPTSGLHPSDVDRLMAQLNTLVDCGNTVILVEHDMRVVAASDWVIDIGPGAGDEGGHIVASAAPQELAANRDSRTAPYLARAMRGARTGFYAHAC